jgi:site-specific recombinase XerD
VQETSSPPFDGLITSHRRSLRAKNLSPRTIHAYTSTAERFAAFGAEHGHPGRVEDLRREHVEEFVLDQLERHTASTAATRFRCLQQFFRYAEEEGEIEKSPMAGMSPPLVVDKPVPVLSDDSLRNLVQACRGKAFEDHRDLAIIRTFIDTGMRLASMTGIHVEHLDLDAQVVLITGKGNRQQYARIGTKAVADLDRYLRARGRHRYASEPSLWLGGKGRFTESGIAQMLSRRAATVGIDHIHPHQFRHTFAHRWLAAGGSEGDLQTAAGWRSAQMVARYGASAKVERAMAAADRLALGDSI